MSIQMNRLFEIVQILLNEKNVTARKLADYFEISVRTVYRDIETLIVAGIPVYCERGKYGGIRLVDGYTVDRFLISEKEQNEILYALQSLKALNFPDAEKTLSKLSTFFRKDKENWIEIEFSRYGENDNTLFHKIKDAILGRKVVRFTYYNTKGEKSERTANPLKIWFKEKSWYLFAYCHKKRGIRQFKISRIKRLSYTGEYFERPTEEFNMPDKNDAPEGIKLLLKIDKSQAYRVYDEFCEEDIRVNKDGNFEVLMENIENEWLYGYLLSYGEYLIVTEPERIRKILLEKVEKMKENLMY